MADDADRAVAFHVSGANFGQFAIPWGALTLDASRKCFILDVNKERLENAPGFDKDHWPAMADVTWAQEVHDYYGQQTYW